MFYSGLGAVVTYNVLQKQGERTFERFQGQKTVEQKVSEFKERVANVKTPEDLLKDRKSLEFVLTAFQMESEIGKTGILRKLLSEDPTKEGSIAARFVDPRYQKLAQFLGNEIPGVFKDPAKVDAIVKDYLTNSYEKSMGEGNPGLREALYFKRNIKNVTKVSQIIGDRALMYVVRTGLGLSEKFGLQPFDNQKRYLEKNLNLEDFQDPALVEKFTKRFLAMASQGAAAPGSSSPAVQILSGGGGGGLNSLIGSRVSIRV